MMTKSRKNEIKRRAFLSLTGKAAGVAALQGPIASLFQGIFDGLNYEVYAQDGIKARNYFCITQGGAPSRWTFDLFLNPYNSPGFVYNPGVGNRYTAQGGRYTNVEYATTDIKGLRAPWIWKFDVPKVGGGNRPMAELLDHALYLQGITTNDPSHAGASARHFRPGGAAQSLPALSADYGNAPIPAMVYSSGGYVFQSKRNKSFVQIARKGNLFDQVMLPFSGTLPKDLTEIKESVKASVDLAMDAIDAMKRAQHPLAEGISVSRKGAEELFGDAVSDLTKEWSSIRGKYLAISKAAFQDTIPGLNDKPIGVAVDKRNGQYRLVTPGKKGIVTLADLRDLITPATHMDRLADAFALAEFVFKRGITRSLSAGISYVSGLPKNSNPAGRTSLATDEHNSGKMITTLLNSLGNRAHAACLLEFVDQMKKENIWKDMLIDVSGEFNRSARVDGTGSDHGWTGKSVALYSGAFEGPLVLGNLASSDPVARYKGTWGRGADVKELNGQMGLTHMGSTIASLLGVPSPITSTGPIVTITSDGKLNPLIEKTKIV